MTVHGAASVKTSESPALLVSEELILKPTCLASTLALAMLVEYGTNSQPFLLVTLTEETITSPVELLTMEAEAT